MATQDMAFEFGENWAAFSRHALDDGHITQARADFASLFEGVDLNGKVFLDIGFGQGLSLLIAAANGARAIGCDVDPVCEKVLRRNAALFPEIPPQHLSVVVGSILDSTIQAKIRSTVKDGFDIVHSWGALHHTGDLIGALRVAADFVAPQGYLVVAIYNRHWSSPVWRWIKWAYCRLPESGRRLMIGLLYPVIWTAKLVATGQNPKRQERGMDFHYDVIDWVGGYPYEYATAEEVQEFAVQSGFTCIRHRASRVPTGCNEFVFKKSEP